MRIEMDRNESIILTTSYMSSVKLALKRLDMSEQLRHLQVLAKLKQYVINELPKGTTKEILQMEYDSIRSKILVR